MGAERKWRELRCAAFLVAETWLGTLLLFAASSLVWVCLGLGRGALSFFWVRAVEGVGGADGKEARPGEASASARATKPSERAGGGGVPTTAAARDQ